MNRVKKNKKKGFTLVELMIVVVIMVILAAAATPIFKGYLDRAKEATYLAQCRSIYIASQTALQDWEIAGTPIADASYNVDKDTKKTEKTLTNFQNDIQRLAQLDIAADEVYTIKIEDGKCTEVVYKETAKNISVTFTPDKTAIQSGTVTAP